MALTPKQRRFVDEYLIDLNATQAALRAGYSPKTADQIGSELLQKTTVAEALQARMKAREQRTEITQDRVLTELAKIGFFDVRKLFHGDGSPKSIADLDDATAAAVAGLDVVNIGNQDAGIGQVMKYKIADKRAALVDIGRHLGMFPGKLELTGKDGGPVEISRIERVIIDPK